ncbi:MAG: hypothetical protein HS115_18615 [Spirochaetales bacterium]|nr:hypothetical protein [Spirochaetales bacterium]
MNFNPEETIATGHQPVLLHPGLLIKFELACLLARQERKKVLFLIADHDEGSADYILPQYKHPSRLIRQIHRMCRPGIYARAKILKEHVVASLQDLIEESPQIFANPESVQKGARFILELLDEDGPAQYLRVFLRQFFAPTEPSVVMVSELCKSSAFEAFAAHIHERGDTFATIHNEALRDYRKAHQIKNRAQPLPDLHPDELPFWIVKEDKRIPLTVHDDLRTLRGQILPRALSLSLFMRLHIARTFVHGTGGGRYDRIADVLLERFYNRELPPSPIATATLKIRALPHFDYDGRPVAHIQSDLRKIKADPLAFLAEDHPLRQERARILTGESSAGRHEALLNLKEKARNLVGDLAVRLAQELESATLGAGNEPALLERTYPYFCYEERDRAEVLASLIRPDR